MDGTKIEWANAGLPRGASWNPIRARNKATGKVGWHCVHESEGCRHCYAEGMNKRLGTGLPYKPGHEKDIEIFLDEKILMQPLRWREPRGIFVGSMTDAFAPFVTDAMLDRMFAVAALCQQHRFLWLTKRSERMRAYMDNPEREALWMTAVGDLMSAPLPGRERPLPILERREPWLPLPNVWLGVSAEDQATANERIPDLLATPAAVRFCSYEPALGPVDFRSWLEGREEHGMVGNCIGWTPPLDLIIAGGESGPHARPMHPDWARAARDQCGISGVAFFWKQWGEWAPHVVRAGWHLGDDVRSGRVAIVHPTGQSDVDVFLITGRNTIPGSKYMVRVGKARAGRLLDGRTHDAMPEPRS